MIVLLDWAGFVVVVIFYKWCLCVWGRLYFIYFIIFFIYFHFFNLILFSFILFYFISFHFLFLIFYFILFYFILFYSISFFINLSLKNPMQIVQLHIGMGIKKKCWVRWGCLAWYD
jgi:hypothetical protein